VFFFWVGTPGSNLLSPSKAERADRRRFQRHNTAAAGESEGASEGASEDAHGGEKAPLLRGAKATATAPAKKSKKKNVHFVEVKTRSCGYLETMLDGPSSGHQSAADEFQFVTTARSGGQRHYQRRPLPPLPPLPSSPSTPSKSVDGHGVGSSLYSNWNVSSPELVFDPVTRTVRAGVSRTPSVDACEPDASDASRRHCTDSGSMRVHTSHCNGIDCYRRSRV